MVRHINKKFKKGDIIHLVSTAHAQDENLQGVVKEVYKYFMIVDLGNYKECINLGKDGYPVDYINNFLHFRRDIYKILE